MSDGVVVDTHLMTEFYQGLRGQNNYIYETINAICRGPGLAASEKLFAEWRNTCGTYVFLQWIADQLKNGIIRKVENPYLPRAIIKKLINNFGLPRGMDLEIVKCANSTQIKYIMSDDMHLYDPKSKNASTKEKERARDQRKGKLCCFLRNHLGITLGTCAHCRSDLQLK